MIHIEISDLISLLKNHDPQKKYFLTLELDISSFLSVIQVVTGCEHIPSNELAGTRNVPL